MRPLSYDGSDAPRPRLRSRLRRGGSMAMNGGTAGDASARQEAQPRGAGSATIIPSCTERDFFEWVFPFRRYGLWHCIYCDEPVEYAPDGTVYIGNQRLECRVEDLGGYYQLTPKQAAPGSVNRCCSERIAAADSAVPLGRTITCPICG